jgi:hypothetical protein
MLYKVRKGFFGVDYLGYVKLGSDELGKDWLG